MTIVYSLILVPPALAQQCYLQQDCGPGSMCGANGICRPVRDVLTAGGGVIHWVDAANGSNSNPGTEGAPWATVVYAAQHTSVQPGDAILIREGTYYGEIIPARGGTSGNRIAYAGYPGERVAISGAVPLSGAWTLDASQIWKMTWTLPPLWVRRVNDGVPQDDDARRRDVLIADDQMLKAVYTRADVVEGTFFLEGSPANPTRMYAWLPGGINPNNARMETSRTNNLFTPSGSEANCNVGEIRGYFHFVNLIFRHTANDGLTGALCVGSQGSLVENVTAEWNNGAGIFMRGDDHIARGVYAFSNGMSGVRGEYCDRCLLEYAESRYNNWKGYKPFWESGGGKWLYTTNSTFRHLNFSDNEGPGLWLDTENYGNTIERSVFDNNYGVNVFLELLTNDTIVRNNVMTRARFARPAFYGYGLLVHAANDNMILHNTMLANEGGAMRIRADYRGKSTGNRYYNNLFVANTLIEHGTERRSSELSFEEHVTVDDARSNTGDGNVMWHRSYASQEYNTFQFRPASGVNVVHSSNLKDWQNAALTDYNSIVVDLSKAHVVDTTDMVKGWRLADGSQIIGKGVALPSDMPPLLADFDGDPRPVKGSDPGADQFSSDAPDNTTAGVPGDASGNGLVTALDASLVLQHASGLLNLGAQLVADASGDGAITAFDASLILKFITGYISCFPVAPECQSAGKQSL
ncbi:MAG: right-handed parallel beta-helix repeat-containing protein [Rhodothermales bacterium]|nr:right-handed parallel beta-helix repeat-containing protein [Rhodothermales bacterium]